METLSTLATAYEQHRSALVFAEHGVGEREPAGRLRGSALSALAIIGAILEHLFGDRPITIIDAFRHGATVDQVCRATGLDVDEVLGGTRMWIDRIRGNGITSADELDEMAALVDRAEATAVAAYDERCERLRAGEAVDGDAADEFLVAWLRDVRRGEPADGEVQP